MTEQVQSLSRRTIQQLASMSRVELNSTFSLALVFYVSAGSGNALPTDSCFTPFLQQTLSTLMVPSLLRPQVAQVFSQFLSKQQGITACSYHGPRYLATSTQGTVFGGSWVKLVSVSIERLESCHPAMAKSRGTMIRSDLFILFFQIQSDIPIPIVIQPKMIGKMQMNQKNQFWSTNSLCYLDNIFGMWEGREGFLCWVKDNHFYVRSKMRKKRQKRFSIPCQQENSYFASIFLCLLLIDIQWPHSIKMIKRLCISDIKVIYKSFK